MIRQFVSTHGRAALAAAVVLALAPPADAQNRGGGRWAGGGRSGGPEGGYYPGGYQPGYGYPGPYGFVPGGSYQSPGGPYGSSGPYAPYQNVAPQYRYGPQYQGGAAVGTPPPGNAARLTVRLPADARLWVDDYQSQQTGPVRVLNTPSLQPGQKYHYVLKAQWTENGRPVTQERTASFQAGGEATVDFTQPDPQSAAEPVAPPARPDPAAASPLPAGAPPSAPAPPAAPPARPDAPPG